MPRIYRKIKSIVSNFYFWCLDYLYVAIWQIKSGRRGYDPKKYLNKDPSAPIAFVIPGIYERWQFMMPVIELLFDHGYSVHVIESLGYNTGSIEIMAERVDEYVRRNEIKQYSIVAHSKGGLIAKYLLRISPSNITKVVTINTPYSGSLYASFFPFQSLRSFMPSSKILMLLATDVAANKKITSIYGAFDPHIPGGSYLEGAINIQLPVSGHFRLLQEAKVQGAILGSLKE